MSDCKSETEEIATETVRLLTEAYGEDCMSHACVFEWHERFSEGRESMKDDDHPGQQRTAVFFNIQGTVMAEWVPSGQTVDQQYYTEILTRVSERVRRKQPELWRNGWILHQDNAPAHNALSVKQIFY